ncbi:hypothetical protein [Streptomyces sp. NPDC001404]|uniref:hypothetical protein n=1 Tax=Streptomyces sp. NPDC001404 TaxID=3364571 RepID=UPI0036BF5304
MAGMFTITGDSGGAAGRLKAFRWTAGSVAWADAVGPRLAEAIRKTAPVGQGPGAGRLRDATRYRRHTSVGAVRLEFHADNVPYVPYVLHPTQPHEIVPRAALALHWSPPGGGSAFARKVHHPGTRGNDYPSRAYLAMRSEIVNSFRAAVEKM